MNREHFSRIWGNDMLSNEELMRDVKNCPFCDGKPKMSVSRDGEIVNVRCEHWGETCLGAGDNAYSHEDAIRAWNRRANSGGEVVAWKPIETAPFEDVPNSGKWLEWCLLGRHDAHGFVEWVGGMDADMWLHRDDSRACADCETPTHWQPLPPAPSER